MKKINILIFLILSLLIVRASSAIEDEDSRYPGIVERKPFNLSDIIKEPVENLELELFTGSAIGYDDNVYLYHHDKVGSLFSETVFTAEAKYPMPVWNWIKLKLGYDLTHILYFRDSDADLFDNILKGGLEFSLYDIFTIDAEYNVDFVKYPRDEQSDYLGNQIEVGVKHDLTDWFYHRISWQYLAKDYDKRKARARIFNVKLGDREDSRQTFEHKATLTLFDRTLLKLSNKLYFNDSNYDYLDYYDYYAYKVSTSLIQLITDKLSGRLNFGYQRKSYDDRNVSDKNEAERDHLFLYSTALIYDITPELSIGLNYSYRRNFSNEGDQQYSGNIVSCGVYYTF